MLRYWPLLLLWLGGCASAPPSLELIGADDDPLTWPAAPVTARYRYLGELTGEANLMVDPDSRQMGRKIFDWLVGLASGPRVPTVLQRPQSGYTDAEGRIYVTDVSRAAVYVFDRPAGALHVWEMAGADTRFTTPIAISPGPNQEYLVTDAELKQVIRLDYAGAPQGRFGEGILKRPTGLAYDPVSGRIYVADTAAHNIKVFDRHYQLILTIGQRGEADGQFNAPTYLSFRDGRLYVTDTLNARVQVFTQTGQFIRKFGRRGLYIGDLPRPKGVAVDSQGHVYVVESYYDYLLVFDESGQFLLPIGGTGSGAGQLYLPAGVWVDEHDRVYVADAFNGRVMVLQYLDGAT